MKKILLFIATFFIFTSTLFASPAIDITKMSISDIQDAVDKGLINYEQLTQLYLDRIDEYSDTYNSISYVNEDAISIAKELDLEYVKSGRRSMLYGIPVIVKDNIDVLGFPTTASSRALKDNYPTSDALIIKRLKEAGAIIIAKGRMSEFAFSATESYNSYGNVYNAYDVTQLEHQVLLLI